MCPPVCRVLLLETLKSSSDDTGPLKQLQLWRPLCTSQTNNPKEGLAEARWGAGDGTFHRRERSPGREGRNDGAHAHLLQRDGIISNLAWIQP